MARARERRARRSIAALVSATLVATAALSACAFARLSGGFWKGDSEAGPAIGTAATPREPFLRSRSRPAGPRARRTPASAADAGAQVVDPTVPEDETEVWREAYNLEAERADLLAKSMETEWDKVSEIGAELREELEGCLVELDDMPNMPASQVPDEWAQAYTAIRRCNEQSELRLAELRSKISERNAAMQQARDPTVTMDFGPIQYMGITFKDISFPRFGSDSAGSQVFFLELAMPLGIRLEETSIQLRSGEVGRAIKVAEVVEGGSAARDARLRVGDYLRAITVPRRRLANDMGEEEAGSASEMLGASTGTMQKALLTIPTSSTFPFEQVLADIGKNKEVDSLAGMVFERTF